MDDCLIVGAGVVGLSLAYELAGRGLRVTILDRSQPGGEASWAGAGILPPANLATANHPWDQLRGLSDRLHSAWSRQLLEQTGIDTGYRRCGGIYLARTAGEAASLHGLADELRGQEIEIERLDAGTIERLEPAIGPVRIAYRVAGEAQIRNPRHLRALVAACRQRGVSIREGEEVRECREHVGRIECLRTRQGELRAAQVCFTAGAWTYRLLADLGVATGILPIRGQMVLFRCSRPLFAHILNEGPRYLVPRDDGRVLAGSTEEEVGFDPRTTAEGIAELIQFAYGVVPALEMGEIERTWAGLRPGSFDGFPYLGRLPGLENAFVAAGHFRNGLFLSPATAVVMSQLMRGERPEIDLAPFQVGR